MQSPKWQMISVCFQGKLFNTTVIQVYAPTSNAEEAEVVQFYEDLQNLLSEVAQSCPTLCDPTDYTVHGILQARILEWLAFPSPGNLPNSGTEPRSPTLQADSLPS